MLFKSNSKFIWPLRKYQWQKFVLDKGYRSKKSVAICMPHATSSREYGT